LPEDQLPPPLSESGPEETPRERALGNLLYALGEALCLERDLSPELVLTKADALSMARGNVSGGLGTGWRGTAVGSELARIGSGESTVSIQVKPDSLVIVLDSQNR